MTACALTAANLPDGPTGLQLLAGRGRRVLDATILADAVATQDTVTSWSRRSAGCAG